MQISKRKILTILTIILLLINIVVAIFIFVDIQIINAPKTEVYIDIVEVNSEEIILDAKLKMYNSNSFQIGIKDFVVTSMNYENEQLGELKIPGGIIPSDDSKVFSEREKIVLKESSNLTVLKNKITGKISVTFLGFITKTIPIEVIIITSVEKIFENLEIPDIDLEAHLTDLSEEGIEFSAKVDVYNPTYLIYYIDNLYLDFTTTQGVDVGNISVNGGLVKPKSNSTFISTGLIKYQALDAELLILKLTGIAGAKVGGISKNISFSTDASLVIPNLKDFVFGEEQIDFRIPVQFKLTLKGILSNVGFSIYNPSNISLMGYNLICKIYRMDNEKMTLLGQESIEICNISPQERICVKTQIIIPYSKYLFSGSLKLIPDWIILRIEGDFNIAGTKQAFPIALNAYVDPNIIKQKEFH